MSLRILRKSAAEAFLASSLAKITLRAVRARITRTSHIDQLHRLSAFWEADVIHVMERGRLVESGD